jgi:PAS domain S-box-containing protein
LPETNLSETARADHELKDRFFAISIDLLCFAGFDGYFKRLSPSWERTLGWTLEELMAKPMIEFVHPDDRARTSRQNLGVRSGGQALSFENRYLCKDGTFRWLHWNATADLDDQVIYSIARDITEHKRTEAERDRLVAELQQALTEVETLQGIVPICSYCRRIRDDEDYWHTVEAYLSRSTTLQFSHSICPSCYDREVELVESS